MFEVAQVSHFRVVLDEGGWPVKAGAPADDARLIAAAPDLLQALLNLVGTMCSADGSKMEDDLDAIDAMVGEAKAAIRKATGA
jgi:hypothetical protein